ncbi:stage II sporulation protein M [Candidatus Woesearchaeota archaeon]|nr:stage II sporulation protein M [Candidatus Woesearchaeota archaeon]
MVFEFLISPRKAERRPWEMFFIGAVYSSLAVFLAYWIFKDYSSVVMVFLTVLACIQFIHGAISLEEDKDKQNVGERFLLKSHGRALSYFMFLFLGFTVAFAAWKIILPSDMSSTLFLAQDSTIQSINAKFTGNAISSAKAFMVILMNNIRVLFFALLFSFFYGAGAIFILAWNASVIGAAMAGLMTSVIEGGIFSAFSLAFLRYFTHGIPEILAYFTAALAGGIISIAIIKHDYRSKRFKEILVDSFDLIILSVAILVVAALIEVYLTPILF